jgi:hypothetical protein
METADDFYPSRTAVKVIARRWARFYDPQSRAIKARLFDVQITDLNPPAIMFMGQEVTEFGDQPEDFALSSQPQPDNPKWHLVKLNPKNSSEYPYHVITFT